MEFVETGPQPAASTRARVVRSLLSDGPATATGLAAQLGITAAAVRKHLDGLAAEGLVTAGERPPYGPDPQRGRGRPARVFALTEAGRERFEHAYDDLAAQALRYLAEVAGADAVTEFARAQTATLEQRYRRVVAGAPAADQPTLLALALTSDGYAASVGAAPVAHGAQICQHHCPVAHVAAEFPQLCEAETEAFARLLGRPVQRLATIAHGDHVCTTFVPASDTATDPRVPPSRATPDQPSERTAS